MNGKWCARIWHEQRLLELGFFRSAEAAARAFDDAARKYRGDQAHGGRSGGSGGTRFTLNFPTVAEEAAPRPESCGRGRIRNGVRDGPPADSETEQILAQQEAIVEQRRAAGQPLSRYNGVVFNNQQRRWNARWNLGKSFMESLGTHLFEEDAARAYDAAARQRRGSHAHTPHIRRTTRGRGGQRAKPWRLNFPTAQEQADADAGIIPPAPAPAEADAPAGESRERPPKPASPLATAAKAATTAAAGRSSRVRTPSVRALESWEWEQQSSVHNLGELLPGEKKEKGYSYRSSDAYACKRKRQRVKLGADADAELQQSTQIIRRASERVVEERLASGQKTSPFKGVSWYKKSCRWSATFRGKPLGQFIDELQAAQAYDDAVRRER